MRLDSGTLSEEPMGKRAQNLCMQLEWSQDGSACLLMGCHKVKPSQYGAWVQRGSRYDWLPHAQAAFEKKPKTRELAERGHTGP